MMRNGGTAHGKERSRGENEREENGRIAIRRSETGEGVSQCPSSLYVRVHREPSSKDWDIWAPSKARNDSGTAVLLPDLLACAQRTVRLSWSFS
jgi:hypothetical protein